LSSVASFRRNPATAALALLETLSDGDKGGGFGATGIGISPDSRFVYVAAEDKNSLSIFRRESDT
jgi:hypothetical protein